jgi:hypothetical protein
MDRQRQRPQSPWGQKPATWQQRGFESQGAAHSAGQQFGLVKQADGSFQRPTMGDVQGMANRLGQGTDQKVSTPYDIGGARWMFGAGGAQFTGQASDAGGGGGNAYDAATQVPYTFGQQAGGGGRQRPANFQSGTGKVGQGGQQGMPHNQIGQQGQGTGRPKNPQLNFGPSGGGAAAGVPGAPGAPTGQPNMGTVGGFPAMPKRPPNFLPMTPGFEHAAGQAGDAMSAAEGAYAQGKTMIGAQLGLQNARLNTDQGVATNQLNENLAGRGVYTPKNAQGGYGSTSPSGGGIGQALYGRNVATPFGRQRQDLASSGAAAYGDLAGAYGQAQMGYNQSMYNALGQRANDAYAAMPLNAQMGEYGVPDMANPMFSAAPGGPARPGRTRPRKNKGKGRPGRKK